MQFDAPKIRRPPNRLILTFKKKVDPLRYLMYFRESLTTFCNFQIDFSSLCQNYSYVQMVPNHR